MSRYVTTARLVELDARLTDRDRDVLARVAALRFTSGAQLTRLCFADLGSRTICARAARRALLRLTRLGVLERLPRVIGGVRAGSAGFVYRLGLVGQRLAIRLGLVAERRWRRSFQPGRLFVDHALAVAELHTELVEADRSRSVELLELSAEPSCWRAYDGSGGQARILKPDSFVRLGAGAYEDRYFIEVDRGTEGSRALGAKLEQYLAYFASGREQTETGVFPLTLWLAPDDERVGVIEGCVFELPHGNRELFRVARQKQALDAMSSRCQDGVVDLKCELNNTRPGWQQ